MPNDNNHGEAATNFWMSVVEGAMCAVFILTTMIVTPSASEATPKREGAKAGEQVVIEAKAAETSAEPPVADASGSRTSLKPTHRLVALAPGDAQEGEIVIELDRELPPNAAVKFLYTKPQ